MLSNTPFNYSIALSGKAKIVYRDRCFDDFVEGQLESHCDIRG